MFLFLNASVQIVDITYNGNILLLREGRIHSIGELRSLYASESFIECVMHVIKLVGSVSLIMINVRIIISAILPLVNHRLWKWWSHVIYNSPWIFLNCRYSPQNRSEVTIP